jgi:hypothetical protein
VVEVSGVGRAAGIGTLFALTPVVACSEFPDAFSGAGLGVVMFSRDARGHVIAFQSTTGGVRGVRFVRLKLRPSP